MQLVSVAALAENRVIGNDGGVPWPDLPEDVRQYRERVADSPVILGHKTFESMRGDLPGRRQIVVSRTVDAVDDPTAVVAGGVDAAIELARELVGDRADPETAVYVLGGGTIYELFQPRVDRMALSHVDGVYEGDTRFPAWDEVEWRVVGETEYEGFTLREWVRRSNAS
ncbi:MAG: dihydrofolate reductase [Halobacteriota archaeon]